MHRDEEAALGAGDDAELHDRRAVAGAQAQAAAVDDVEGARLRWRRPGRAGGPWGASLPGGGVGALEPPRLKRGAHRGRLRRPRGLVSAPRGRARARQCDARARQG